MEERKSKRKPISKTLRFEVFKRDSFTCQYCGRMAPDVVLEIDHINPVANGGDNDIMNLVTSCRDCNRGKGKRTLSSRDEIKAQQAQLKELSEKREQLKMMIEWREELEKLADMQVDVVNEEFRNLTGRKFTDIGRCKISKMIDKYGLNEVCDATKIYVDSYYDATNETFSRPFETIGGICRNRERQKENPSIYWINKIAYTANFKFPHIDKRRVRNLVYGKVKCEEDCNMILQLISDSRNWSELKEYLEGEI